MDDYSIRLQKVTKFIADYLYWAGQPGRILNASPLVPCVCYRERAEGDWFELSAAERRERTTELGTETTPTFEDFEVTQAVFEKLIEPTPINPHSVTHAPKELIPLAKPSPDDPTTVEVFECCINGQEIAPADTEQNDPIAQRERLGTADAVQDFGNPVALWIERRANAVSNSRPPPL